MIWELDIQNWFKKINKSINIKTHTISDLVFLYYRTKGVTLETTTKSWLIGIAQKKYPTYTTAYRHIRQLKKESRATKI